MDARVAKNRLVSEGNALFYTLVPLARSLSLFLSLWPRAPRALYFYHPLGTTSIERPTQKDSKRSKREETRARGGRDRNTSTGRERMEVTRRVFSENKPPPDIVSITARTSLPKGGFQTKNFLSLPLSFASRSRIRLYDKTQRRRRRIPRNIPGKVKRNEKNCWQGDSHQTL